MSVTRYILSAFNHGVVQATGTTPTVATLAVTGAGVWVPVETHHTIRMGAFVFDVGTDVTHTFLVHARYVNYGGADTLQFRIRDLTAPATIATITWLSGRSLQTSETFTNLPSADAEVQFQYTLVSPSSAEFSAGEWEMFRSA